MPRRAQDSMATSCDPPTRRAFRRAFPARARAAERLLFLFAGEIAASSARTRASPGRRSATIPNGRRTRPLAWRRMYGKHAPPVPRAPAKARPLCPPPRIRPSRQVSTPVLSERSFPRGGRFLGKRPERAHHPRGLTVVDAPVLGGRFLGKRAESGSPWWTRPCSAVVSSGNEPRVAHRGRRAVLGAERRHRLVEVVGLP